MFGVMITTLDWLYKIYLVVELIEQPTQRNYLTMIAFYNLYFFGYMWTFYLSLMYLGLYVVENPTVITSNVVCQEYLTKFLANYRQPSVQRYVSLMRGAGHYTDQITNSTLNFLMTKLPVQLPTLENLYQGQLFMVMSQKQRMAGWLGKYI